MKLITDSFRTYILNKSDHSKLVTLGKFVSSF